MTRRAKPEAAQVAPAQKAAAVKAGQPNLTPQEWALCYQGLNLAIERGLPGGAPTAVAVLNTMAKIEPVVKAAQAARGDQA